MTVTQFELRLRAILEGYSLPGKLTLIGIETPRVYLKDNVGNVLLAASNALPTDGTPGYSKGCIFLKTDAAGGLSGFYENQGTVTSCLFTFSSSSAGYGDAFFTTAIGAGSTAAGLNTTLLLHALVLASSGGAYNKGFTHKVGQANAIASVAEYSAGVSMEVTTTGNHNLVAGEPITHTGFAVKTAYRGKKVVQLVTAADKYIVLGTWTGTDAGFMKRGFTLRVLPGAEGIYRLGYSISGDSVGGAQTFRFEVNKSAASILVQDNLNAEAYYLTAGANIVIGASGLISLAINDYLWLSLANLTTASDFNIRHLNLSLAKT